MDKYELRKNVSTLIYNMLEDTSDNAIKNLYIDVKGIFSVDDNLNLLETIIKVNEILDINYINSIVDDTLRIKYQNGYYRFVTSELKFFDRRTDSNDWRSVGNTIVLRLNNIKVIEDNKILIDKVSEISDTSEDLAVALLDLNNYIQGYINTNDNSIFGVDMHGNTKLLYCYDMKNKEGSKPLSFNSLGKNYNIYSSRIQMDTEDQDEPKVIKYISLPYRKQNKTSNKFYNSLNKNGVIVVNDMRNENIIDDIINYKYNETEQINIIQLGLKKATSRSYKCNINYFLTNDNDFNYICNKIGNNIILDQSNMLDFDTVNRLAENNLVIINSNVKNVTKLFQKFDNLDEYIEKSFINKLLYFGNPYTGNDFVVDKLILGLLSYKKYNLVDRLLDDDYTPINSILISLIFSGKEIEKIYNSGNDIYIEYRKTDNSSNIPSILKKYKLELEHILELLVYNGNMTIDEAIDIIYNNKTYKGMLNIKYKDENRILRVNIAPSNADLPSLVLSVIPNKNQNLLNNRIFMEKFNIVVGKRGSGKTDVIRSNMPKYEFLYIYDNDYEFVDTEYSDYNAFGMIVKRGKLDIDEIRQINPTIVVINSKIDEQDIIKLIPIANRNMKIVISETTVDYDLLQKNKKYTDMLEHYKINPNVEVL